MCGRFTVTERDLVKLARALAAEVDPALAVAWHPRFNVAPGSSALLVREAPGRGRCLERARFGFPGAGTGKFLFNARLETAPERRAFRTAWATRRCVVPADGFYEWSGTSRARRPLWFHDPSGQPLLFAALWDEVEPRDGVAQLSFSILTTAAQGEVGRIHDRMPVIVPHGVLERWLAGTAAPDPGGAAALTGRPVSERVNAVSNDDAACLDPPPPERQLALF